VKVAVVYCYPLVRTNTYFPLANRFAQTWKKFPPGEDHELHVINNGGGSHDSDRIPFQGIKCRFHQRDNFGWDIGAFQWSAENIPCDLMVCLGAPVHFHRAGWLARMVDAYVYHGPNLYGCWGYLLPNWHLRTTCFWLAPDLLKTYPMIVGSDRASRYDFEHGNNSITRHVLKIGLDCIMVTWDGIHPFAQWKKNIGPSPSRSLVHDQFTYFPDESRMRTR
jgi:hypothetical protein